MRQYAGIAGIVMLALTTIVRWDRNTAERGRDLILRT
jgi:hypothetical protein